MTNSSSHRCENLRYYRNVIVSTVPQPDGMREERNGERIEEIRKAYLTFKWKNVRRKRRRWKLGELVSDIKSDVKSMRLI
jgi:hypothetical protein